MTLNDVMNRLKKNDCVYRISYLQNGNTLLETVKRIYTFDRFGNLIEKKIK